MRHSASVSLVHKIITDSKKTVIKETHVKKNMERLAVAAS